MSKIIVKIPLTKYLREITKEWEKPHVTKTYGGQVWISDEAPGDCFEDEDNGNYIEFNDSCVFVQLPKEIHQHIELEPGQAKPLSEVLKGIKQKEAADDPPA